MRAEISVFTANTNQTWILMEASGVWVFSSKGVFLTCVLRLVRTRDGSGHSDPVFLHVIPAVPEPDQLCLSLGLWLSCPLCWGWTAFLVSPDRLWKCFRSRRLWSAWADGWLRFPSPAEEMWEWQVVLFHFRLQGDPTKSDEHVAAISSSPALSNIDRLQKGTEQTVLFLGKFRSFGVLLWINPASYKELVIYCTCQVLN